MITAHHLVFGRKYVKEETATWGSNSTFFRAYVSTREDNIVVDWQDGTTSNYTTLKNTDFTTTPPTTSAGSIVKNYSTAQIRNIQFKIAKGLKDVYSLAIGGNSAINTHYILDWSYFINQFNNLYSLYFFSEQQYDIIGDLSQIPDSLERIQINNLQLQNNNDFYLNVSNFSQNSKLKYFNTIALANTSLKNIYGDLSKLPPQIQYFSLAQNNANTFTYTAGRNWSSSFDTLNIGNAKLSVTDTDNLLIDLNNSITTAIGSKVINLANCYATSASVNAIDSLKSKGFTITLAGLARADFLYINNMPKMLIPNGVVMNTTDHKGGTTAIQFGSGNLVTEENIPTSSVWSLAFWMKSSQTSTGLLFEHTNNLTGNNIFSVIANSPAGLIAGRIYPLSNIKGASGFLDDNWHHIVIVLDRNELALTEVKIYKDSVQQTLTSSTNGNNTGDFLSDKLYIGGRGNTYVAPFIGVMSPIKMFNYPLSQTEIDNLYNE